MKTRHLFLTLLFLFFAIIFNTCKKDENIKSCLPDFEPDPPGNWYFGDFHVHATGASNDTGGDSYPTSIQKTAIQRGLHFLVLTDHSNSTGSDAYTTQEDPNLFNQAPEFTYWDSTALLSTPNFLFIDGNEISPVNDNNMIATGHIGCIPKNLQTFDKSKPIIDRPKSTVTGGNALQQATDMGCYTIINHPYSIAKWIAYDWTSLNYNALEVWNGTIGYDEWDKHGHDAWVCDLLSGKKITAIGGSDTHRVFTTPPGSGLDPAIGYPTTAVFAEELSWNSLINGLEQGKTSIFEGNSRLFIDGYNITGCIQEDKNMTWIRLRGQLDANCDTATLVLTNATACADTRPSYNTYPSLTQDTLFIENIIAGKQFDYKIAVVAPKGVYTAQLIGKNTFHYAALSRAIVVL